MPEPYYTDEQSEVAQPLLDGSLVNTSRSGYPPLFHRLKALRRAVFVVAPQIHQRPVVVDVEIVGHFVGALVDDFLGHFQPDSFHGAHSRRGV